MKNLVIVVGCLLATALVFVGCEKMKPAEEGASAGTEPAVEQNAQNPAGETAGTVKMPGGTVATIVVGSANFSAEVAQSDSEREAGLQGRQEPLAQNAGMWFVFPQSDHYSFWMKNTPIPLDWIFVEEDATSGQMTVVDLKKNNQPNEEVPYKSVKPCRYVLEVNAGTVDAKGIKIGDVVQYRIGN
jgi:uncharacterized membrane protein (UPF0127 family)